MDLYLILFLISLGLNMVLLLILIFRRQKKPISNISFEEAFCVLNGVIETQRVKFFKGLNVLSKRYVILNNDGKLSNPNELVKEYSEKKKELKIAITKKVIRNISKDLRMKILEYYSENGLLNYIITELDKESELGENS